MTDEEIRQVLGSVLTGSGAAMRNTYQRQFCEPGHWLTGNYDPAFWRELLLRACVRALERRREPGGDGGE